MRTMDLMVGDPSTAPPPPTPPIPLKHILICSLRAWAQLPKDIRDIAKLLFPWVSVASDKNDACRTFFPLGLRTLFYPPHLFVPEPADGCEPENLFSRQDLPITAGRGGAWRREGHVCREGSRK